MTNTDTVRVSIVLSYILFLSGCTTVSPLSIPVIEAHDESSASIMFADSESTFALAKLVNDIDHGDVVFALPSIGDYPGNGAYCNHRGATTYTYQGGREYLGDWSSELGEIFYDTLSSRGYSIAGDPADLFTQATSVGSAEYLVGGRITSMKGNFCHKHHWWDGRPLMTYGGEMYVEIEWSVLNTLTKDVIITTSTSGYATQEEATTGGIYNVFASAFASAAESFAAEDKVVALALGNSINEMGPATERAMLLSVATDDSSKKFDIKEVRRYVTTIRIGQGHGSGFFIGQSGHVLTNAHVVGDAKRVQVITESGIEVEGSVIAVDKIRDVALIETPMSMRQPAPLDMGLPDVADEVYAVGTPLREDLDVTVTKGIVSAFRVDRASNLQFIQADVPISPGNSGGPLLDGKGNIIGISVAKYSGGGAESLSLFIPLQDAFSALGITLDRAVLLSTTD